MSPQDAQTEWWRTDNWIEDGRAALARYRDSDGIDQTDTDAMAEFVERLLKHVETKEQWTIRFDGAVRRYDTHGEAIAEAERIITVDIPAHQQAGWPSGLPVLIHEIRSTVGFGVESSEVISRVLIEKVGQEA